MQIMHELRRLYGEYAADAVNMESIRQTAAGTLGIGSGPADNPGQDKFSGQLKLLLSSFAAQAPGSGEVSEVLRFIYEAPQQHRGKLSVFWMLVAVHTLTEDLIGLLSREDAAVLSNLYRETYPKNTRLPVQTSVTKRLAAKAEEGISGTREKKGLFGFFKRLK